MSEEVSKNAVEWDAAQAHPELAEAVREGLREVIDPELGMDIIQLGLVRNLRIDDNSALVTMMLTTPFCPYGPAMLESTRQKAEEVLGIPTNIEFSMEMWDFSYMEEGAASDWGMYY